MIQSRELGQVAESEWQSEPSVRAHLISHHRGRLTRLSPTTESDDDDEEDDNEQDELDDAKSVQSYSRMTARQAARAVGLESEHVELRKHTGSSFIDFLSFDHYFCPLAISSAPKKKVLTQAEIVAKRTESARKRKSLSAKKLEDDKVRSSITYCACSVLMRVHLDRHYQSASEKAIRRDASKESVRRESHSDSWEWIIHPF